MSKYLQFNLFKIFYLQPQNKQLMQHRTERLSTPKTEFIKKPFGSMGKS